MSDELRFPRGKKVVYCIGAQKAGTTWLGDYVSAHPSCFLPPMKELHFFEIRSNSDKQARRVAMNGMARLVEQMRGSSNEEFAKTLSELRGSIDRAEIFCPGDRGLSAYLKTMTDRAGDATHLCDFTPAYATCDRNTFAQMSALADDAYFVFILRDPVARIWSQARMAGKAASENRGADFEKASRTRLRKYMGKFHPSELPRNNYAKTIEELESVIPADRILYLFYETLFSEESIQRFCDFIGVPFKAPDFGKGSNVGRPMDIPHAIEVQLRTDLEPQYIFARQKFGDAVPKEWYDVLDDPALQPLPSTETAEPSAIATGNKSARQ